MIVKIVNIKGTEGANLIVDISHQTITNNIRKTFSGFVSSTTAKSKSISYERMTEVDFKEIVDNTIAIKTLANSEGLTYSDKVRVAVGTGTSSKSITEGTIEIYVRNRM